MSHERRRYGGGDRRRDERRIPETEEQKLRNQIVRLGDNAVSSSLLKFHLLDLSRVLIRISTRRQI